MAKIEVDENQLRNFANIFRAHKLNTVAQEIESMLPEPLPTAVGTVIMWREDNDAGLGVGAFAERVHVYGKDQWRKNGYDVYSDTSMQVELDGKTWWEMVKK